MARLYGPRWAYGCTNVISRVWGDSCDVLRITAGKCVKAMYLLADVMSAYEKNVLNVWSDAKQALYDNGFITGMGEDEANQLAWQWDLEENGLQIPDNYLCGMAY